MPSGGCGAARRCWSTAILPARWPPPAGATGRGAASVSPSACAAARASPPLDRRSPSTSGVNRFRGCVGCLDACRQPLKLALLSRLVPHDQLPQVQRGEPSEVPPCVATAGHPSSRRRRRCRCTRYGARSRSLFCDLKGSTALGETPRPRGDARGQGALLRRDGRRDRAATAARSRSTSATRSWPCSACRCRTRTMRCAAVARRPECRPRCAASTRICRQRYGVVAGQPHRRQHRRGGRERRPDGRPEAGHRRRGQRHCTPRAGSSGKRDLPRRDHVPPGARRGCGGGGRAPRAQGKSERVAAFRLVSTSGLEGHVRRHDSPIVGRDEELAAIDQALREVTETRAVRMITIIGDAGIGKSRLAQEVIARAGTSAARRPRTLPRLWRRHHLLAAARDDRRGGRDSLRRQGPRTAVPSWRRSPAISTSADRLAAAIGLSRAAFPLHEIYWAARKFFESLTADGPLVALVDDIHWAESAFLDLTGARSRCLRERADPAPLHVAPRSARKSARTGARAHRRCGWCCAG